MPGPPEPSALQTEAMDTIDALVADPALHLDMVLEEGDLQIVSNHRILHSRTAYVDWEDPARKRHMLRLWLACADGPDLPPVMTEEYQEATEVGPAERYQGAGCALVRAARRELGWAGRGGVVSSAPLAPGRLSPAPVAAPNAV